MTTSLEPTLTLDPAAWPISTYTLEQAQHAAKHLPRTEAHRHDALPLHYEHGRLTVAFPEGGTPAIEPLQRITGLSLHPISLPLDTMLLAFALIYPQTTEDAAAGLAYEQRFYELVDEANRLRGNDLMLQHKGDHGEVVALIDDSEKLLADVTLEELDHLVRAAMSASGILGGDDLTRCSRGHLVVPTPAGTVQLRLTKMPTRDGHATLGARYVTPHGKYRTLEDIGMRTELRERFDGILRAFAGMIIASGPPSNGKSTLMLVCLALFHAATKSKCIRTIEDPVEAIYPEFDQHSIEGGLTYADALATILSLPTKAAFFGEVRDQMTMSAALRLGHSGIPVFSTTHGISAPQTLRRLYAEREDESVMEDLSVLLRAVLGQRLVKRLCTCARELATGEYGPEARLWIDAARRHGGQLAHVAAHPIIRVPGDRECERCIAGFFGRIPIFEIFEVTSRGRDLIARKAPTSELATTDPLYTPLWVEAAELVLTGQTSPVVAALAAPPPMEVA